MAPGTRTCGVVLMFVLVMVVIVPVIVVVVLSVGVMVGVGAAHGWLLSSVTGLFHCRSYRPQTVDGVKRVRHSHRGMRQYHRGGTITADTTGRSRGDCATDRRGSVQPGADDLRLLRLLLDGLTDQAIAGKLDVGTRTVQRRVRDLIDVAGVHTRLQLIWHATRSGWI